MNSRISRLIILLIIVLAALPCAAEPSSLALDMMRQRVKKITLRNGARILFYRRGIAPVFSGVIAARVGSINEPTGETGISHLFEHIAFKGTTTVGTKNYPLEKKLLAELEAIARRTDGARKLDAAAQARWDQIHSALAKIWDEGAFSEAYRERGAVGQNASTSIELTTYFVSLPKNALPFWAAAETDRMLHPVARQFYRERDVVMEERRMRVDDDPQGRLYELLLGVAFLQHPYHIPVIGYRSDIEHLTAAQVIDYHKSHYVGRNMVIGVVGDVNSEKDLPVLSRFFGRIPAAPPPERRVLAEPKQEGERVVELNRPASPYIMIGYHKPVYPDPDDASVSLLVEMLSGSRVSPIYRRLVKETRVAAGVHSFEAPGQAYPNLIVFQASPRSPHTPSEVLAEFDKTLSEFMAHPVSAEDLDTAKRKIAKEYIEQLKDDMSLANLLASAEALYNDWEAVLKWYEQAMSVTTDDIASAAKRYFQPNNRVVARVEHQEEARPHE